MDNKKLRIRLNKIRDAQTIITNEINSIYSDNAECNETIFAEIKEYYYYNCLEVIENE